jgi:hypothetical protein
MSEAVGKTYGVPKPAFAIYPIYSKPFTETLAETTVYANVVVEISYKVQTHPVKKHWEREPSLVSKTRFCKYFQLYRIDNSIG